MLATHFRQPSSARVWPAGGTEEHIIETRTRASESVFRGFFEGLAVGAVQLNRDGRFMRVNDRYCTLTGYRRDELLQMEVADLDHPADRIADRRRWDEFLHDPSVGYDVEKRYIRHDGSVIWVHVTGAFIPQEGDEPLIAKTVEDITDRVNAIDVLRDSEERLREALAVKEEFLGLVSHELRTPLTVVVGMANILTKPDTSPQIMREVAREIRESAEHLESLLESMLVLARADRGDDHDVEPIQLTHVLRRAVERHCEVYPTRPVKLDIRTREALVEGYEPWLAQIIGNLLGNAEKYSPPGAEILVALGRDGDEVVVRVSDHGLGISADDLPLIFDPFYRAAHAREVSGGLGLGLAVCKRLVELQGGRIWASSEQGGQTEFAFALPVLDEGD